MPTPAPTWGDLEAGLDEHEFGYDIVRQYGGIPPKCYITYGPSEPIIAIMPILKNLSAVLISRYGLNNRHRDFPFPWLSTDLPARYKAIADSSVRNDVLRCTIDDVVIYGELKGDKPAWDSFLMFWMDRSGKCSLARVMKSDHPDVTLEQFKAAHIEELKSSYADGWKFNDELDAAIITDIPGHFTSIQYP